MNPTYAKHAKENLVVSREEKQRGWTNRTTALLRPGIDAAGHPSPPPMVAVTLAGSAAFFSVAGWNS